MRVVLNISGTDRFSAARVQVSPWEQIKGELLLEYDTDASQLIADEAFIALDAGEWEFELGRLYTPFGVYLSQFASGPILEYGETRSSGIKINFNPREMTDLSLMVYQGRAGTGTDQWDWALAWQSWLNHCFPWG